MTASNSLPTAPFGDCRITRLIGGGNPLCGNSHWSHARSREMAAYHTPEQAVAYLRALAAAGINTIQARGDYHRVLYWLELFRREGGAIQWIAQTASEMADVQTNIRVLAAAGVVAIYHHGTQTDRFWHEGHIDRVEDYLKSIRDQGVRVGLGTHIPEVVMYAEEKGWDLDFYMTCVYNLSRRERQSALVAAESREGAADEDAPDVEEEFLDPDPAAMYRVIQATDRQCLAFKILGAGRRCQSPESVRAAFAEAFAAIKPQDAVVVGMWQKHRDEISLNVAHATAAIGAARG